MSCLIALLCFLGVVATSRASGPIVITNLPDGISVTGGESLRQIIASWEIYVTLDPPAYPQALADQVTALAHMFDAFQALSRDGHVFDLQPHILRRNKLARLLAIDTTDIVPHNRVKRGLLDIGGAILNKLPTSDSSTHHRASWGLLGTGGAILSELPSSTSATHNREKRGLLDIGGSILNKLFGVATSAQLDRFKAAMLDIADDQAEVAHSYSQLASIVNQTRTYAHNLAVQQHQLETNVFKINKALSHITMVVQENARRIHRIELLTSLDRHLDILDIATNQYMAQVTLFHRQRAELELGHLTRDLLTPAQLKDILAQAAGKFTTIPNTEWYYQSLMVTPLWRPSQSALLYKIELPLVADRPYLLYHILSHPVPINNSSYRINIDLEPAYALDTMSGKLFIPRRCLGHSPIVCNPGAEFGQSMLTCPRGILTNRPQLVKTCAVKVHTSKSTPVISPIELNQFAVTSWGENLIIRCPGVKESHLYLPMGAHNITCLSPCTITAQAWSFQCLSRLYVSRRYSMPKVEITANFNFSTIIDARNLTISLPQLEQSASLGYITTDIGHLLAKPIARPSRSTPKVTPLGAINAVLLFALSIIVAVLIVCLRRTKGKFRMRFRDIIDSRETLDTPPEILPLKHLPAPTATSTERTTPSSYSIWPTLPRLDDCRKKLQPSTHSQEPFLPATSTLQV